MHREQSAEIADWLLCLTHYQRNWGFRLCFLYLHNVKGFGWNHKRVYRIYRELELNLRIKPRKRLVRETPEPLTAPTPVNECWSMDFIHDQLSDGGRFRLFNVLDDYNREGLGVEIDLSLPADRVIRSLTQIIEWRGKPTAIRCDNGPNSSATSWLNGLGSKASISGLSHQASRSRTLISNVTTAQPGMTDCRLTSLTRLCRCRTSQHAGSGHTIMNGQIWPWGGGITPRQKLAMVA